MSRTYNPDRDLPDPADRETEPDDDGIGIAKTIRIENQGNLCTVIGDDGENVLDLSNTRLEEFEVDTLDELVRRYNAYDILVARLKADRHTFAEYWRHHVLNGSHEKAMNNQAHVDAIDAALMKASKA